MSGAIGIRFDDIFLKKIEKLSKEDISDRSTTIRKLAHLGYKDLVKKKAAEKYMQGKITMSEAAHMAELTMLEMEHLLVELGYKSDYSVEDLNKELDLMKKI